MKYIIEIKIYVLLTRTWRNIYDYLWVENRYGKNIHLVGLCRACLLNVDGKVNVGLCYTYAGKNDTHYIRFFINNSILRLSVNQNWDFFHLGRNICICMN